MNEEKLMELLRQDAETITPPEALQPDQIEAALKKQAERNAAAETASDSRNAAEENAAFPSDTDKRISARPSADGRKSKHLPFYRYLMRYGSLAAVLALSILAVHQAETIEKLQQRVPDSPKAVVLDAQTEAPAEETGAAVSRVREAAPETTSGSETSTPNALPEAETDAKEKPEAAAAPEASAENERSEHGADTAAVPEADPLSYAGSYEEIYDILYQRFGRLRDGLSINTLEYAAEQEIAADTGFTQEATAAPSNFSDTNLMEAGVNEADIVKTDGRWIYILRRDLSFAIIRTESGSVSVESITKLPSTKLSDVTVREMYLDGDQLTVIADGWQTSLEHDEDIYYTSTRQQTILSTFDISDRSHPVQTGTLVQDGTYADSRKVGSYVYVFTTYAPYLAETYDDSAVVPRINGEAVPAQQFYLPQIPASQNYLVIASVDLNTPEQVQDQKVLVSGADLFYVSQEHIYIANENYQVTPSVTEITKFHYADGQITGVAAGSVEGSLNNGFSMNEYEGCLRVVATSHDENWEEWNSLHILDESLQPLSSIEDLAEGETIQSARFLGDIGYFVTFRQTDPLFSVDLSDPEHPQILGELKISGFSSYLHFYGEDQLLGIGYEADEENGFVTGLKLSMFDISDPEQVVEKDRLVLSGITWCPSIDDYKSILVQPEKNLIGFFCDNRYLVYSYDEEHGFQQKLLYDFYSDGFFGSVSWDTMRGLYIEDCLYLAGDGFVVSFDMTEDFTKQEVLSF